MDDLKKEKIRMKIDKDVIIEIDNRQDRINITRETES